MQDQTFYLAQRHLTPDERTKQNQAFEASEDLWDLWHNEAIRLHPEFLSLGAIINAKYALATVTVDITQAKVNALEREAEEMLQRARDIRRKGEDKARDIREEAMYRAEKASDKLCKRKDCKHTEANFH